MLDVVYRHTQWCNVGSTLMFEKNYFKIILAFAEFDFRYESRDWFEFKCPRELFLASSKQPLFSANTFLSVWQIIASFSVFQTVRSFTCF